MRDSKGRFIKGSGGTGSSGSGATLSLRVMVKDDAIQSALTSLATHGDARLKAALKDIGEHLVNSVQDRFDAQQDPNGAAWEALNPAYAKKFPKILTETRRLRDSIVYQLRNNSLLVGTNVVYAAIHQFGGKTRAHTITARRAKALAFAGSDGETIFRHRVNHPGSNIPARPYLGLSADDTQELLRIIDEHLQDVLKA